MNHATDESRFLFRAQITSSSNATTIAEAVMRQTLRSTLSPAATLVETVSALSGDVPGGSLENNTANRAVI